LNLETPHEMQRTAKKRERLRAEERYPTAEVLLGDAGDHPDLPGLDLNEGVGGLGGQHPRRREERASEGGEAPPERGCHLVGDVQR
jgi:hypothetical protein